MINDIQRASMWKRISAYIFDSILLITLAVGVAFLLSVAMRYDDHTARRELLRQDYEARYGVSFDIGQQEFEALTDEEQQAYNDAYAAFATDPAVNRLDVLIINLSLVITVLSILSSLTVFEILIPWKLGNGQTLGKKIFGLGVMHASSVKISTLQLFIRAVLGKYTLETMIPVFLVLLLLFNVMPLACLTGLIILFLLQLAFVLFTRLHTPIHDMISGTVVVDFTSQMIFDTPEQLLEYTKAQHAEAAKRSVY